MQALFEVRIKGFEPLTAHDNTTERKKALVEKILKEHTDLDNARANCEGKQVFVDVRFFLLNKTAQATRYEKDLDNLLKIVLYQVV
ncbi:MAG TPA: hypothetical protein VGA94_01805 [Thermodesulfobacteriota bacterium]